MRHRIFSAALILLLTACPARSEWPQGSLGELQVRCRDFVDLTENAGHARDQQQLFNAVACRSYLEGYLTGLMQERYRPGSNFLWQRVCMPGTNQSTLPLADAIKFIMGRLDNMREQWNEAINAYPWVVVTLEMGCNDNKRAP